MKRNTPLILLSTAVFSFLFYDQSDGINQFLFYLILLATLILRDKSLGMSIPFLTVGIGGLSSAFFVYVYGTEWPLFMSKISLLLLAGFSFSRESSILAVLINSLYSFLVAPIMALYDKIRKRDENENATQVSNTLKKFLLALVPMAIVFIFIQLYRFGNPIFDKYISKINLDFISFSWILFTIWGGYLMIAFFKQRTLRNLKEADIHTSDSLDPISFEQHQSTYFGSFLQVPNEVFTGILLFGALNLVLATVNGLDAYFIFYRGAMPSGISLSTYVHQGTNGLIFSIVLASMLILFYFRGYLHFYQKNSWLKWLSYTWLAQNVLLVISTAYRNGLYIQSSGFTNKRIGVIVYLTLCVIGLMTVAIKIIATKNNWFLFRKNAWALYLVLIAYSAFDWDSIITNYNIHHFVKDKKMEIDQRYLAELSHTNLATLFQFYIVEQKKLQDEEAKDNDSYRSGSFSSSSGNDEYYYDEIQKMIWRKYSFLERAYKNHDWQSDCLAKTSNLAKVKAMIQQNNLENPIKFR